MSWNIRQEDTFFLRQLDLNYLHLARVQTVPAVAQGKSSHLQFRRSWDRISASGLFLVISVTVKVERRNVDIGTLMVAKNISTLKERREQAFLNFALKNEHTEKYGKRWLKPVPQTSMQKRNSTRDRYLVPFCRTDRLSKNPVIQMAKVLNDHYQA